MINFITNIVLQYFVTFLDVLLIRWIWRQASDDTNGQKPFEIHHIFDAVHYIDDFMYICGIVFFLISVPLNLILIGAIVLLKRLHLPRILLWLGTGFSNIFILTMGLNSHGIHFSSFGKLIVNSDTLFPACRLLFLLSDFEHNFHSIRTTLMYQSPHIAQKTFHYHYDDTDYSIDKLLAFHFYPKWNHES